MKCPHCDIFLIEIYILAEIEYIEDDDDTYYPQEVMEIIKSGDPEMWYDEFECLGNMVSHYCVKCRLGFHTCYTCSSICWFYGRQAAGPDDLFDAKGSEYLYHDNWKRPAYFFKPVTGISSDYSAYTGDCGGEPLYCACLQCDESYNVTDK